MRALAPILAICVLATPATALADAKGNAVLKKYDTKQNRFKDLTLKITMKVKHHGRKATKVKFKTITRPGGQRLIKMLYPGDIKGMHILVQSKSEMYIYLPAYRKVRRIAGHVRNQGFMGSGFTYDDMAINLWSKTHNVRILRETRKHWLLELKAKAGQNPLYRHIRMRIRKDLHLADRFHYFNHHGKNYKTQKFLRYKCVRDQSYCMPMRIVMVEHARGNRKSVLKSVKYRRKRGYPDRMFTIRHLLRSAN